MANAPAAWRDSSVLRALHVLEVEIEAALPIRQTHGGLTHQTLVDRFRWGLESANQVHRAYVQIASNFDSPLALEALKRALYYSWSAGFEPAEFSGVPERPAMPSTEAYPGYSEVRIDESVMRASFDLAKRRVAAEAVDEEFISLLAYYASWAVFFADMAFFEDPVIVALKLGERPSLSDSGLLADASDWEERGLLGLYFQARC